LYYSIYFHKKIKNGLSNERQAARLYFYPKTNVAV
jgi:hypothetical protein